MFENTGGSTARTQLREIVAQAFDRALHLVFTLLLNFGDSTHLISVSELSEKKD
jgi:hypothetical protein